MPRRTDLAGVRRGLAVFHRTDLFGWLSRSAASTTSGGFTADATQPDVGTRYRQRFFHHSFTDFPIDVASRDSVADSSTSASFCCTCKRIRFFPCFIAAWAPKRRDCLNFVHRAGVSVDKTTPLRWFLRIPGAPRRTPENAAKPRLKGTSGSGEIRRQPRIGRPAHTIYGATARPCVSLWGSREWSGRRDSNSRPTVPKTVALPGCATPRRALSSRARGA